MRVDSASADSPRRFLYLCSRYEPLHSSIYSSSRAAPSRMNRRREIHRLDSKAGVQTWSDVHRNDAPFSPRFVAWWAGAYKLTFKKSFDPIIRAGTVERNKESEPSDMYDLTDLTGFGPHPFAELQFHLDSLVPKADLHEDNLFAGSRTTVETLGIPAESSPQRSIKTATPNNRRNLFD